MKPTHKQTQSTAGEVLALLKQVITATVTDPAVAGRIYAAAEKQLKSAAQAEAFQRFCKAIELPDLEPATIASVTEEFRAAFNTDVVLTPKENSCDVKVTLPDGQVLTGTIAVSKLGDDEQEIKLKFIPFPVCLAADQELIWLLARRENMSIADGAIALTQVEDAFWGSKTGQKLLRDRVERTFAEFISRVSAGALAEMGLKRLFKTPEVVKQLHTATI